MKWYNS